MSFKYLSRKPIRICNRYLFRVFSLYSITTFEYVSKHSAVCMATQTSSRAIGEPCQDEKIPPSPSRRARVARVLASISFQPFQHSFQHNLIAFQAFRAFLRFFSLYNTKTLKDSFIFKLVTFARAYSLKGFKLFLNVK